MLEEWRPLLCPFDVTVIRGLSYYELFLPTSLPPEKHHMGFKYDYDSALHIFDEPFSHHWFSKGMFFHTSFYSDTNVILLSNIVSFFYIL